MTDDSGATPEADRSDDGPGRPLATADVGDVDIPAAIALIAGDAVPLRCVWRNELGGLTFELPDGDRFLKWAPTGSGVSLLDEADRLRWAHRYTPVPEVIGAGTAAEDCTCLLTARLAGTNAVAARWKADPRTAVRAIGEALRAFHECMPVASCPFTWMAEDRLAQAEARTAAGAMNPEKWHSLHRHLSIDAAMSLASDPPPVDRLVVCHADSCAPNTLINNDGTWSGHVDLGQMGVGDRWADIAIATWSTTWNYGPGWDMNSSGPTGLGRTRIAPGTTGSFGISATE